SKLAASELGSHGQVKLTPVLVERTRLIPVEREVLEGRIVQVFTIERHREHVIERVLQGCRQASNAILREGRVAVQPAEERRAVRVGDAGAEVRILEVPAEIVGVLGGTYQPVISVGDE